MSKKMPEDVKEALRKKRLNPGDEALPESVQAKQKARKAVDQAKPKMKPEPAVAKVGTSRTSRTSPTSRTARVPIGFQGRCRLNPDGATHAS